MDPTFHYYGTFLAALTMGLPAQQAQSLAYFTHAASRQTRQEISAPLYYQGYRFTPVLTADDESRLGRYCCNLAFQSLPALLEMTEDADKRDIATQPQYHNTDLMVLKKPKLVCQNGLITRCYYNPLTDIDWQQGGEFKRHFSQRLAKKANLYAPQVAAHPDPQAQQDQETPNEHSGDKWNVPTRLNSAVDSALARKMLNDVIYKSHYDSQIKGFLLPLFGCRLHVYQNTWQGSRDRSLAYIAAFRASCYAIHCWYKRIPLKHIGNWHDSHLPAYVVRAIRQVAMLLQKPKLHSGNIDIEQSWARLVAQNIPEDELHSVFLHGISLRETHLLDLALAAGAVSERGWIHDITGFKQSEWFKFNKAAAYHCDWLSRQLCQHELSAFNTGQSIGNHDMWR
ncbi:hypothetical protein [Pseudoalteromonas luteoviolacea]|uniref:Uncharacterized protein n=1 Tax=Pseudoalteromonas luteoviolacea (strain 2ta16) TaxID=1353533 RepID=V4HNH6_PSEL2|nr:hypothetical protein [Pseudoalteromonas luteoviolacea]ESP91303.1 hypothetical protein PL2TA16_00851 [Pseudoalteromonas luteoviolacea 2ta16]KZN39624.1 hypothetical protein N483_19080 [Pseudoalteromonas luteoviolacea NCIMB 1944]